MLVTVGDFRQVGPVVRLGGRKTMVASSIQTQRIFQCFEVLQLTSSIRQASDPQFSALLDSIGDNMENEKVDLGMLSHTQSVLDCLNFVFPADVVKDSDVCIHHAILSPFNEFVDGFNSDVLDRVLGDLHEYMSSDTIEGDEDGNSRAEESPLSDPDFIHSL